ncbi:Delta(1)-pyrroline-2-carboxylate reductase [Ensifer adhaerens]|uniref:ornithine cyclodeaminase n=1 Tax=Ensifer adhaerens TaxID=106592 RepID=UPI001568FEB0|nr:ornithine cyclodeaminase [Ensifer adhaerens]NRP21822.1 Delta(1)-pyrroline-2-carboxylate reductase [Ensifer adhaerens]
MEQQADSVNVVSIDEMRALGAELTIRETHDAVEAAWHDIRQGHAIGGKAVLSLPEDEFWAMPEFTRFKDDFRDERLGWKLSSLFSANPRFGGVKIIGANAFNRRRGYPRSTSTYVLLDKPTLRPVAILDGTAISAMRTGTYASVVTQLFLQHQATFSLFLFGAGPVARSVVDCLSLTGAGQLERIYVRSRTLESAVRFVEETVPAGPVSLIAVDDNQRLCECALVVTASNSRYPVFKDHELAPDAVTLHLGGNEAPIAYLQRVLRSGVVVCDDIATVSRRNSQSLPLYFSSKGLSLETIGPLLGVGELSSGTQFSSFQPGPVCITCVGLPMLDLYVAEMTWKKYCRALQDRAQIA